jgi:diguanylate cyclase
VTVPGYRPAVEALARSPLLAAVPKRLVAAVWPVALVLVAAEAVYQLSGAVGSGTLFNDIVHDAVLGCASVLCLARGFDDAQWRPVSLAFGLGLLSWTVGDVLWGIRYADDPTPPYPSAADALWLAWYPLTALGIALLIRLQITHFHLHRWLDGVAVMLIVLTPCAALLLEPAAEDSPASTAAAVVNFSYPILDALLIGAVLGVYGVTAWRPGRTWLLLGLGCIMMAVGDGLFAVQEAREAYVAGHYDFIWPLGAVLIAYAIWRPSDTPSFDTEVVGWRAIVLPVTAQALAAAIQIYSFFHELGSTERIITLVVLVVAIVQIILARPRATS